MKDKKRVLTILLILIIVIAIILAVVLIFGGVKTKQLQTYHKELETAACKMAKNENYTEEICNAFPYLCKVKYEKLLSNEYIKKDLRNPLTEKKMSDDTKSFIEIKWKDGKMICTHKEG